MKFEEIEKEAKARRLISFDFFVKHLAVSDSFEEQEREYIVYIEEHIETYEYHTKNTSGEIM